MAIYHVDTVIEKTIDGFKCTKEIQRDIKIDIVEMGFKIGNIKETDETGSICNSECELIPQDMEELKELTDLFPTDEYKIRFTQTIRNTKKYYPYVIIRVEGLDGKNGFYIEDHEYTEREYSYLLEILKESVPAAGWLNLEEYTRKDIKGCIFDEEIVKNLTDEAYKALIDLLYVKRRRILISGTIECDNHKTVEMMYTLISKSIINYGA